MGVSIGVERLFSLLEARAAASNSRGIKTTDTQVMVISAQKNMLEHCMAICSQLWDADINVCSFVWEVYHSLIVNCTKQICCINSGLVFGLDCIRCT